MIFFYMIFSYLIGSILFGVIVSKWISGKDIRTAGSKNAGARNAGRLFGKKAFIYTFLGDALKGSLVIIIGKIGGYSTDTILFALLIACIGHIKPIFFQFSGGKGISVFIGGLITLHPIFAIVILSSFGLFYLIYRKFTVPGFFALFSCCLCLLIIEDNILCFYLSFLTFGLIVYLHHVPWQNFIPFR